MSAGRLTHFLELVGRVNSPPAVVVLIGFYGKAGRVQKYFRGFIKFGVPIAQNLRRHRPRPRDYGHLDEMVLVIRGRHHGLWRAVDNEVTVLDFLVQPKRDARAALRLMRKLLKKQGGVPPGSQPINSGPIT